MVMTMTERARITQGCLDCHRGRPRTQDDRATRRTIACKVRKFESRRSRSDDCTSQKSTTSNHTSSHLYLYLRRTIQQQPPGSASPDPRATSAPRCLLAGGNAPHPIGWETLKLHTYTILTYILTAYLQCSCGRPRNE